MSQYRQLSPKSPIKLASKSARLNKSIINTPPCTSGAESKHSEKVTTISHKSECEYDITHHDFQPDQHPQGQAAQLLGEVK